MSEHRRKSPQSKGRGRPHRRMRRGIRRGLVGGVCSLLAGAAGYGAYTLLQGAWHGDPPGHPAAAAAHAWHRKAAVLLTAADVARTAHAFLAAWSAGDTGKAAGLTDEPAQAADQLAVLRTRLHATSAVLTARPATGTSVPFSVDCAFRTGGRESGWHYDAKLTVVRGASGRPLVGWAPSVLHPALGPGQTLTTDQTAASVLTVLDRYGKPLTPAAFPSLGPVLDRLRAAYATATGGSPGTRIRVEGPDGRPGPVLHQLSQPRAGAPLPTTLDPDLQAAAERAVATRGPHASAVVIRPSSGAILAIANRPAAGYDTAVSGTSAPGSTFKLITASAALETGRVAPDKPLDCPKNYQYGGRSFHNVDNFSLAGATLAEDFAQSCNTAFISTAAFMPDDAVSREAREVFGIGLDWSVGVPAYSGSVPAASGALKAMSYIGQGSDLMSPLAMASVASTVEASGFHQPYVVPPQVDGRAFAHAARQLSAPVAEQVRSMMRLTAQSGTAAPAMNGLGGDIGAKTGTAEVDGQARPDSWFVAYRGDVAAAATVPDSGEGYRYAGPIVASILRAAG